MLLTRRTGDFGVNGLTTLTESKPPMWRGSVGDDLEHLEKDRAIRTDPEETRRRRTIKLEKENHTWGFALQTYGIKNKKTKELEVMTYVDYVELHGPAGLAGMRRGDVILSVNGESVEGAPHKTLVKIIQQTQGTLRLVVLFEDCCRKVELYERFIKLKQILKMKIEELRNLERKENHILEGQGNFSRLSSVRSSLRSSTSSDWDRFSMVVSPAHELQNLNTKIIPSHMLFPKSYINSQDDTSELSVSDVYLNNSFSDDSDPYLTSSASCSDIVSLQGYRKNKPDTLSNRSVSSLITNAENQTKESESRNDSDVSPLPPSTGEQDVKGNNSVTSLDDVFIEVDNTQSDKMRSEENASQENDDSEILENEQSVSAEIPENEQSVSTEIPENEKSVSSEIPENEQSVSTEIPENEQSVSAEIPENEQSFPTKIPENEKSVSAEIPENEQKDEMRSFTGGDDISAKECATSDSSSETGFDIIEKSQIQILPENVEEILPESATTILSQKGDNPSAVSAASKEVTQDSSISDVSPSPEQPKRFCRGVFVNDNDQTTKL